ncbi:hypothetical protein CARUB_v10028128mg [Capsella rubella]|uniref:Remorin C-terminal domain-containing protein n=1 Tax=Capsella rubella TaxID=81985 RepID=R0GDM7_9BRAS|nr:remorin [Capsella rubella]EOA14819.1 hypothetical protein CARUB_v10028128mg [Capsella rubella]
MDNLVKQRRRRVSISEKKQTDFPTSELDITDYPALNWLKNQSYWYEKNDYYNEKESEFAISVAAAAFVIRSMEEADKLKAKRRREEIKRSRTKITKPVTPNTEEKRLSKSYTQEVKIGESFRKNPLEYLPKNHSEKEIGSSYTTTRLPLVPSKADSWENSQIKKIRLRYEKMKAEIVGWENKRKLAVNLRMEKRKSELEKRKQIYNQHYKSQLARIYLIADGAKKQLEEKSRSKEARVHEKAKKMRPTNKVPTNYFCFRCY